VIRVGQGRREKMKTSCIVERLEDGEELTNLGAVIGKKNVRT
jgi:hypothetical protein